MEEWQMMVEDCEKRESKLSEWEVNFIDSVSRILDRGCSLTPSQDDVLTRIWDRVTS